VEEFHVRLHTLQQSQRTKDSLKSSSGSYVMCGAAIITNRKCQMSIATRLLFWTANHGMDNTGSNQFCNLFTCWTFVSVPFLTLPVAINFNSHKEHVPYFQSAMILARNRTSLMYHFGFRVLAAACVGVSLTFRRTLQLPYLGRIRGESTFEHKTFCESCPPSVRHWKNFVYYQSYFEFQVWLFQAESLRPVLFSDRARVSCDEEEGWFGPKYFIYPRMDKERETYEWSRILSVTGIFLFIYLYVSATFPLIYPKMATRMNVELF
jgi:hypothetical protein